MSRIYRLPSLIFIIISIMIDQVQAKPEIIDFLSSSEMKTALLNPTGGYIAAIVERQQRLQIILIDPQHLTTTTLLDLEEFSDKESTINRLSWLDEQSISVSFNEIRDGTSDLIDSKMAQKVLILTWAAGDPSQLKIKTIRTPGILVHPLPSQSNQFLYAKSGDHSAIYRIAIDKLHEEQQKLSKLQRVDGGQFKRSNQVSNIKGYAIRWFFDQNAQVSAVLHFTDENTTSLSIFNAEQSAQVIHQWDKQADNREQSPVFYPIAQGGAPDLFYCLDTQEPLSQTVYRVNFTSKDYEIAYQSNAYQVINIQLTPDKRQIQTVTVINNGAIEYIYLDNEQATHLQDSPFANHSLQTVISKNLDNTASIYYVEHHNQPGQFILKNKGIRVIGGHYPKLNNQLHNHLHTAALQVNNLSIPYLLTIPKNTVTPHPLIVMPHGGPIGIYDDIYFDPITQLLATQGYAVLRVNFRGSGGYSHEFSQAGSLQYGDLILEDIYQVTLAVAQREDIHADQICIFGASYGGYAATTLSIKYPQTYLCAATFSGVSDLNLQLNGTNNSSKTLQWFAKYVGDTSLDYERLKAQSPVFQIQQLSRPWFIYHGGQDKVVLPEQAFRLKLMLEKYQKPFEWHFDPQGKHYFEEPQQAARFYGHLLTFLATHLGTP